METPEERAERIFREDEEKRAADRKQELVVNQQRRKACYEKNKEFIEQLTEKSKGIRYRTRLQFKLKELSEKVFQSEEQEYGEIGEYHRGLFFNVETPNFSEEEKAILRNIAGEYGAFCY